MLGYIYPMTKGRGYIHGYIYPMTKGRGYMQEWIHPKTKVKGYMQVNVLQSFPGGVVVLIRIVQRRREEMFFVKVDPERRPLFPVINEVVNIELPTVFHLTVIFLNHFP